MSVADGTKSVSFDADEDMSAQHLIDFSPIYRCLHIYTVLSAREFLENYYRKQREKQARLVVQPSFGTVKLNYNFVGEMSMPAPF